MVNTKYIKLHPKPKHTQTQEIEESVTRPLLQIYIYNYSFSSLDFYTEIL